MLTKTGQVYWRDEEGKLWFAQSFVDHAGVVTTTQTPVEEVKEDETPVETETPIEEN